MVLFWKGHFPWKRFCMSAADIADAFLTVAQINPTSVSCGDRDFACARSCRDRGLAVRCGTIV